MTFYRFKLTRVTGTPDWTEMDSQKKTTAITEADSYTLDTISFPYPTVKVL